ncbi:MAG: beta-lactamase family protein [Chloroflexi bacterium]|nr:beta-lactamase family protein [Chloroflexota bacterium]
MSTVTRRLEETIRETMARRRVAGLALALVKDGELVAAEGFGVANVESGEKVAPNTRFAILSVTKTIVSTAVMQLRERGLFALDEPVNQCIAPARITNDWEAESPVTTRQLLTHTAGLPVGMYLNSGKLPLAEFVTRNARTVYRPGTDMVYANWGFDAAGVLISRLSGRPVDDYLRESIFEPLGMTASALASPDDGEPRACGHYRSALDDKLRTVPIPDWPTIPAAPAGGVWSNVLDLAKFLIAHLTGGAGILSGASIDEMHRMHARQGDSDSGQGIGFRVTRVNGRHTILHGGDDGFTAFIAAQPEASVGVAMLMNTGGMQAARSVIGNSALATLAPPERRTFSAAAAVTPGLYKSTFWEIELEAREDTLTAMPGFVLAEEPAESVLQPTGDGAFGAAGGMFHGFELAFEGERIYGGVYPFTFVRTGEIVPSPPIDPDALLIGDWAGEVTTPLGPMRATLHITEETALTVDTPFGQNVAASSVKAAAGRVEGEFAVTVPGMGEMQLFLRLEARGGKLTGKTYARAVQGEAPLATELVRA